MSARPRDEVEQLLERLIAGQRFALARAITLIESRAGPAPSILRSIRSAIGNARTLGLTGAPGVGKSTLINAVVREYRSRNKTVAVAAVDPSSPLSGGAVLGDRVRMGEHGGDDGVFIRSISSRGHLGGLSATTAQVVDLMDAAGWERIIVETVGAGQSQVEIAQVADVSVVVCAPGLGDDVQAMKAGILEIADVLVVNKADHPRADETYTQLVGMLDLGCGNRRSVPVLSTVATNGRGVVALVDAIEQRLPDSDSALRREHAARRIRFLIAQAAAHELKTYLSAESEAYMHELCERVARGELSVDKAARALLDAALKARD